MEQASAGVPADRDDLRGALPVLRHALQAHWRGPRGALTRTLVVAPSWIGDAVLSQPLLARVRQADPAGTIDVLAPPWVAPVYRRMPEVARTLENPFGHGALRFAERRRFARGLTGYDR